MASIAWNKKMLVNAIFNKYSIRLNYKEIIIPSQGLKSITSASNRGSLEENEAQFSMKISKSKLMSERIKSASFYRTSRKKLTIKDLDF